MNENFDPESCMKDQARTAKVLVALVVSMTAGAFILMSLDEKPLSASGFNLSGLYRLTPVSEQIPANRAAADWDGVEVYYSTPSIDTLDKLVKSGNDQLHFVITGGEHDGAIKSTEKWRSQMPCKMDLQQGQKIIRICILNTSSENQPSNCQVNRTVELVEYLSRHHNISSARIRYPVNWQI